LKYFIMKARTGIAQELPKWLGAKLVKRQQVTFCGGSLESLSFVDLVATNLMCCWCCCCRRRCCLQRSDPRLVLQDVVLVIPEQSQIDGVIYWVNAFNSELEFWRNRWVGSRGGGVIPARRGG
jgi:hypothetical protein